ncbi:hypothetical protein KKF59_01125 [Patescibacteria group bacterium]|nr:hypothetical protein [Patescibacteria group bacterium]MBU1629977.1 hypothetical protein [Patescibacteria group bacterium]MBU1907715.1 hypothetical protein [Patescibacteria group bacterium]
MPEHKSHQASDFGPEPETENGAGSEVAIKQLTRNGLDRRTALRLIHSSVFDCLTVSDAVERIECMFDSLTRDQVNHIILTDPANIMRPVSRIDTCLNWLVLELEIPLDDAQEIIEQCFAVLNIPDPELQFKCTMLAMNIRKIDERVQFLLSHPEYFLLPSEQTKTEQEWVAVQQEERQRIVEALAEKLYGKSEPAGTSTHASQQIRKVGKSGDDAATELVPHKKTSTLPSAASEPPKPLPTPIPPPQDNEMISDPSEEAICRIPLQPTQTAKLPRDELEKNDAYIRSVIEFLVQDRNVGLHWDIARPYVIHRPWLADPALNVLRILETLVSVGIRGDRLWNALRHEGFVALGYDQLKHVMLELKDNRDFPLPDNITDLAIPKGIFLQRMYALSQKHVHPRSARYKLALYAKTQREFKELLSS